MANRLKYLREQNNYSQEQVAIILGITTKTYRSYEQGHDLPCAVAQNLANQYKVSVDYLMGYSDFTNIGNREIAQLTGLNDLAIELLKIDNTNSITHLAEIINHLITCNSGRVILSDLYFYLFGSYGSGTVTLGDRFVSADEVKEIEILNIIKHIHLLDNKKI